MHGPNGTFVLLDRIFASRDNHPHNKEVILNMSSSNKTILNKILFFALLLFVAVVSAGLGVMSVVAYQVFWGDDSDLHKSTILARINEETTIYTLDEKTPIGSFFNNAHRSYVSIDRIPAHMIRAMVASEDKNFYNHAGVDPFAVFSAFADGVAAGMKFRRGGSTITQQTVKNVMDRREHSFKRKFKEMIRALQLERIYSKDEILEFYLNQFHVTSNGNGIGIAARYYFNKPVEKLELVEAAFIAGSVKAPSRYNPFTKFTKKAREKARDKANTRKDYVIGRMLEMGWISRAQYDEARKIPVPFVKGKFTSKELALVSVIKGQLNKKEILDALGMDSIEELNYAGLKVYTTIDAEMQSNAQLMMRRNLSRLEYLLDGFKTEDPKVFRPLRSLDVNQFYFGKVSHIAKGPKPEVGIDYGFPVGTIPYESLVRTAKFLTMPTYKGVDFHLKEIIKKLKVGDVVLTEIKEYSKKNHKALAELKVFPGMNGGMIAVDRGEVRAVVSGFEAKGFNRAMFATRQPGSVFKTLVYFAALQLGWQITDQVDNQRRTFPYQGNFYYPRPDHASPFADTSILWSGIKSENLASIYLATHLLDKINFGQFKELMGHQQLLPLEGESVSNFHYRVARKTGVQLDIAGVKEQLLGRAIHDLRPDLLFAGSGKLFESLNKMIWGRGYLPEWKLLLEADEDDISLKEKKLRIEILAFNYERLNALSDLAQQDWQEILAKVRDFGVDSAFSDPELAEILKHFVVLAGGSGRPKLGYVRFLPEEVDFFEKEKLKPYPRPSIGRPLNPLDVQAIWGSTGFLGEQAGINFGDVWLMGKISGNFLAMVRSKLDHRLEAVLARRDRYSLYNYFNHHDFRIGLGLSYLVNLSRAMGVYSKLEAVQSFPLGTNVVSVAEVAKIYQTFVEGKIYRFYDEGPSNQLNFIKRIEDRDGNILFEPKKEEIQLVDPCIAHQTSEILRKVVTHGTGRRARGELQVSTGVKDKKGNKELTVRIPAFGKTGTTNDYTTAYFAGYVPYPVEEKKPLDPQNSLVLASYVGYDLNKTMRNGLFKITGARGALPVWTDFARSFIKSHKYQDYLDNYDLGLVNRRAWPLKLDRCGYSTRVDLPRGTMAGDSEDIELFDSTNFESDGETFINEFARTATVKSYVQLLSSRSSREYGAKRKIELFDRQTFADEDQPVQELPSVNDADSDGGAIIDQANSEISVEAGTSKDLGVRAAGRRRNQNRSVPKSKSNNNKNINNDDVDQSIVPAPPQELPVPKNNEEDDQEVIDEEELW